MMTVSLYICLIFVVSNSQSSIIYNLVFFVLSEAHLHFIKCFPAAQYPTARSLAYNSITISPYLTHLRSSVSIHWCVCIIAYPRVALPSLLLSLAKCVLDSMLGEVCSLGGALLFPIQFGMKMFTFALFLFFHYRIFFNPFLTQ